MEATIETLKSAVEVILNPVSAPQDRQNAQQVCEEFKENSPHCIQCGMLLAEKGQPPIVRHFGLQLLEHCVKYRWMSLNDEEKAMLKQSSLALISNGTEGILTEQLHVKDAVTKLVVEILKHEWPNLWTSLMSELYQLCMAGPTQTELVLKVFLRLVEDIIIFKNLHHQRRREIMNALSANIGEIFELFINLLQDNTNKAEVLASSGTEADLVTAREHVKVSVATLQTLNGYLDWVPMCNIIVKDSVLLQMLCLLLSNTDLQMDAAECLLTIVSRKGKVEERKPLLILFHEGAMSTIWNAAVVAERASQDEHFYVFLQRVCQILVELGKQLCALWGSDADVGEPPVFEKYLEALLACTQHSSQMLSSYTCNLWAQFLRHEKISVNPVFTAVLPRLVETASKALMKVGFPSQNNSPSCVYARLDFDNDEEFAFFFSKFRAEMAETIRLITLVNSSLTFGFVSRWLRTLLDKPLDSGDDKSVKNCNLSSPSFLEWDALTMFMESVMARITLDKQSPSDIADGIDLLKAVLLFDTQDPLILSSLLSCISALFIFLERTPDTLPQVLQKIFSAVIFNLPGQTKSTRSKAVKNVRQHACSVLVKICKQYQSLVFREEFLNNLEEKFVILKRCADHYFQPYGFNIKGTERNLCQPVFDELYSHTQSISSDPEQLSQMEKCILTEALILVSNQYNNFEKQSTFLEEVIKPVKEFWASEEFNKAFWSPDKLMSYVGLDQAPVEPSSKDTCGINRSHISYCVNVILGVIKRSHWPDNMEVAKAGGFTVEQFGGECIMRNPATKHITGMLENVLTLLKSMNMLFCEEFIKLRHIEFAKAYDMLENDILSLLGIPPPCVDNTSTATCKQPLDRMKHFLTQSYDISCHILGNAGQCLGSEFYAIPNLADSVVTTVLSYLDVVPDYRLRSVIRVFLKSYILSCPNQYYNTAVLPVLAHICPYMYLRLGKKWLVINQRCQTRTEDDEENQERQEVLDEHLARQITRDYLELLAIICCNKRTDPKEEVMTNEDENVQPEIPQHKELGTLGKLCLATENICESLVLCVFSGLSWLDTTTCNKCMSLVVPIIKQLFLDKNISSQAANHFYSCVLFGLQLHGQHEGMQSSLINLGLQVYELLRPMFPDVRNVMLQIPNCMAANLEQFDGKILNETNTQKITDKKKKEMYRKLAAGIIGKNMGELFKREVHYKSLPNLFRRTKLRHPALEDVETKDIGLCALFKPEPNGTS